VLVLHYQLTNNDIFLDISVCQIVISMVKMRMEN
jgi:hypothetical protein